MRLITSRFTDNQHS